MASISDYQKDDREYEKFTLGSDDEIYVKTQDHAFDDSTNTVSVNEVSPAEFETLEFIDTPLLDAVTAATDSPAVDVSKYNKLSVQFIASGVTSGATRKVQASLDGTNWIDVSSTAVSSDGTWIVEINDVKYKYIRARITSYTDGTYTTLLIAGR